MSTDSILWISCGAAEAVVIALLLYRRVWRLFPLFFGYSVWVLLSGIGAYAVQHAYSASAYLTFYLIELIMDSALLFGVLVELGWSVVRPLRPAPSRRMLIVVSCLILALGAAIWPFSAVPGTANLPNELRSLTHLQQTFSILKVVIFLALAACSQLLSLGWRNRELQIVTGLGFTSLAGLGVAMLHTHLTSPGQYHLLNRVVVASYLCSLVYWIVSFAQAEQERREFTPQMQGLLLAIAGSARATRASLAETAAGKPRHDPSQ